MWSVRYTPQRGRHFGDAVAGSHTLSVDCPKEQNFHKLAGTPSSHTVQSQSASSRIETYSHDIPMCSMHCNKICLGFGLSLRFRLFLWIRVRVPRSRLATPRLSSGFRSILLRLCQRRCHLALQAHALACPWMATSQARGSSQGSHNHAEFNRYRVVEAKIQNRSRIHGNRDLVLQPHAGVASTGKHHACGKRSLPVAFWLYWARLSTDGMLPGILSVIRMFAVALSKDILS